MKLENVVFIYGIGIILKSITFTIFFNKIKTTKPAAFKKQRALLEYFGFQYQMLSDILKNTS